MKRLLPFCLCLLAMPPVLAVAVAGPEKPNPEPADATVSAWPVTVAGSDSLHQLEVPADVYARLGRDDLRDLVLVDADGEPVPMALLPQEPLRSWLDLPTPMRIVQGQVGPLAPGAPYPSERARVLVRAQSTQSDVLPIQALRIEYEHPNRLPADATFRIRQSPGGAEVDDTWLHLHEVAEQHDPVRRVGTVRVLLEPVATRDIELALAPVPSSLTIRSVMAEYAWPEPPGVRWEAATLLPQEVPQAQRFRFEFASVGPAPWHRARVRLGDDAVGTVRAFAEASPGYWRDLGTLTVYDISLDDARFARNTFGFEEQRLRRVRLEVEPAPAEPPRLELAYRPDRLVFSHRGPATLTLLAGGGTLRDADHPVVSMLEEVRHQFGQSWQPPEASVGPRTTWNGPLASVTPGKPAPKGEYRAWLLWSLLTIAAVVIGWMALGLAKDPKA